MYPEYDSNDPSLGQAWANMLRGFQNPQQWQETGQGIVNTAKVIPNVVESLGRGGVAQAIGTMGDLRDLRNTAQSYLPKSVQNWSNAAEFLTNPYAKALIQTAPTTESTLDFVPRATAPYEGYKQHETLGEYIAPSLGYFGSKALKVGKDLPIGLSLEDVTPPVEPAKVAEALRQPQKNELGFYSPLDEAVINLKNEKGTGQQYLAQLLKTGGVKPDEVAYRGLDTFLTENPKVTKGQIEQYLSENPITLNETVLGQREPYDANRLVELENEYTNLKEHPIDDPSFGEDKYDEMIKLQNLRDNSTTDSLYASAESAERAAQRAQAKGMKDTAEKYFKQAELYNTRAEKLDLEGLGNATPTKFGRSDLNLPNGENYREVLIQQPNANMLNAVSANSDGHVWNVKMENGREISFPVEKANDVNEAKIYAQHQTAPTFVNTSHFEQPNILTHLRVDDRTIDGKKTLFIQEIQSDWHQAGRKKGYQGNMPIEQAKQKMLDEGYSPEAIANSTDAEIIKTASQYGVPNAPFKKTEQWAGLAMKRAMQMAAEGGYDRVAFTTGKQQADRYSLQKQVKMVSAMPSKDGKYNVYLEGLDGDPLFRNRDGFSEYGQKTMTPEEMEATIGKEITKKLIEGKPNKEGWVDVRDKDLTVGGEGMHDFYDKILPNFVKKYGEKHGIKVGKTKMRTSTDKQAAEDAKLLNDLGVSDGSPNAYEDVHYFDLTPEAKESFLKKGQPMFAAAPAIGITDEDTRREVLEKLFNSKK